MPPRLICLRLPTTDAHQTHPTTPLPHYIPQFGKHRSQFSRVPSENSMHDWMHVMVRYCDGGSFSGTSKHVMEADGLSKEPRVLHMQGRMVLKVRALLKFHPASIALLESKDRVPSFTTIMSFPTLACTSFQNDALVDALL